MPTTTTTTAPMTVLDPEVAERLSDIREHAAACGRLDCGHLSRSTSRATRRAVILYTAEGAGITINLDAETPEVAAIVGVLRESQHSRPVYVRQGRTYARALNGATVLPDAHSIRLTPERTIVFTAMLKGMSASEISADQGRARATVQSHAGWLRRLTGAHDATSALVALVIAHRLSDRAMTPPPLPEDDDDTGTDDE